MRNFFLLNTILVVTESFAQQEEE
ncbi:hypothetical protein PMIN01_10707 [Paraphaeosphaeria minitans]|uniref:Uncharacterized protein n=1 Tax=Paraphaeosphaeria minitans TaxID=565426 RepID=A0A9P6GC78_9PLEO|nr:hypothetical protein PMIN01_10707 [Paraphaeosphaeria minitans]